MCSAKNEFEMRWDEKIWDEMKGQSTTDDIHISKANSNEIYLYWNDKIVENHKLTKKKKSLIQ